MKSTTVNTGRALLAVATFLACGTAVADHAAAERSISVTGHGDASGRPDQAQVSAGVQTLAATVIESSRENQAIVDRIMAALKREGIAEKNVQTSNYSIWPEQRHDPRGENEITITGYRVSNMVTVTIDDIERVGAVLSAVTTAGANTIHGVNFGVKDTAALEQQARAAAVADARARAESLAKLAGVELGEVLNISMTTGGGFPVPMMRRGALMEMSAEAPVPGIAPGELNVSVQVNVSYAIR